MTKRSWLLNTILAASVMGLLVSGFSLASHYSLADSSFCSLTETLDCDLVNKSPYSEIVGIPVALIGLIGYFFLFAAAWMKKRQKEDRSLSVFLVFASLGGFLFSLYLTGIEAFVLHTWCLLCLISQLMILIIFLASVAERRLR